ncbi:MAG TPA: TonB-dependent receptor [Candidatus Binatia bacterium]|nr:TonB-dependent receptor [Candidatus Binatia bacterium]
MRRLAHGLLALGLSVAAIAAAGRVSEAADEAPAPERPVERVEVRGNREGEAALDTTAFATVIRAEDFAGRVTSVTELLRDAVGVQVRGLGGEFATVSIRGSTAEQVVVYLDGVPLNRAIGGGVNLADLPLGQVETIEVYRGFTPAGLAAASIGGAILIHTRRTGGAPARDASISIGSFLSGEAIASVSGTRGRGDYTLGFDAAGSQGDYEYLNTNGTMHEPGDDRTLRRDNNDFRRGHLSGRLSLKAGPRARFQVATDLFAREEGVPGLDAGLSPWARFTTTRWLVRPELEVPGLAGGRLLARVAADFTRYREEFDDPRGLISLSARNVDDVALTESLGAEAGLVLAASSRQAISFLASRRSESADLEDLEQPGPNDRGTASRRTTTVTLEDQIAFASDRLVINPSLRHERYDSDFRPGSGGGVVLDLEADRRTTGKVGFRWKAGTAWTVKGNVGRFLRLPGFIEMFGNRGSVQGNAALRPESGRSMDVGLAFEARRPAGALLRQTRVEATLFETRADDLIQFISNSQGTVKALNFNRARIRGIEVSLALALGPRFTGSLNATHQEPIDVSGRYTDGKVLPGRPQDEAGASAAFDLGPGRLFYAFTYVGRNFIDTPNTPGEALPARYLHDAGYRVRLRRGLQGTVEIKNIADRLTRDVARYPLPGRSIHGRLSWSF